MTGKSRYHNILNKYGVNRILNSLFLFRYILVDLIHISVDCVNGVISQGNNLVVKGTFHSEPCAVKRVIKPVGTQRNQLIDKGEREIGIWMQLSDNSPNLPIVRCLGFEENDDFWSVSNK